MPKKTLPLEPDRLEAIERKLQHLEEILQQGAFVPMPPKTWIAFWSAHFGPRLRKELQEEPVEPWKHLVRRAHPWRKQLYIKGRNLTARQLVGSIKANHFDEGAAATDYHLPVEVVREALAYVEQNKELLATESEIERLMHKRGGETRGPQPVPG